MNTFNHIHSSSRFDRSNASLTAAALKYNADAELVTYTENAREDREKALRVANGDEFGMIAGDFTSSNDGVICFKKERFKVIYKESFKTTDLTYFRVDGKPTPKIYITIGVLEDKTNGKRFAVGVVHMASSVESEIAKKITTRRTLSWFASFRGGKARLNKIGRKYKCDARLYVADFNIDFKKAWARALVKSLAPAYLNTWKNVNVTGGTHGRRIIDATLVRGNMGVRKSAKLYPDDPSSDHRPYVETLVWL